jgi:hypothetical protein
MRRSSPIPTSPFTAQNSSSRSSLCFRKAGQSFDFFSTATTLGTHPDVTLQEIRVECFFPADAEAGERARRAADRKDESIKGIDDEASRARDPSA